MPKIGTTYLDRIRSAIIGDHFVKDAVRVAAGIGVVRPNTLIGIVTATKRANVVRRCQMASIATKTITLKTAGDYLKFKVGDPVKSIQYITTEYTDKGDKVFSLTETKICDLGNVTVIDAGTNKITFDGTIPNPAIANNDIIYVADGSEKAVGITVSEINTNDDTWDDNVSFVWHGFVNKNLVKNYDAIAAADLKFIQFVDKEVA